MKPLHLYPDPGVGVPATLAGLLSPFALALRVHESPLLSLGDDERRALAEALAAARVVSPTGETAGEPLPGETVYEEANLVSPKRVHGPVYDGLDYARLMRRLTPLAPRREASVVLTEQFLATRETGRWHLRVVVLSWPQVLSTSGVRRAPAPSAEDHFARSLGLPPSEGPPDDAADRTLAGYLLQCAAFALFGPAFRFCADERCALSDAHTLVAQRLAQGGLALCDGCRSIMFGGGEG